jgi:hypothetical protein
VGNSEVSRLTLFIEIVNFLLRRGDFVTTTEIHEFLYRKGILKDNSPGNSERRRLNRTLEFLEQEGYIESKHINLKGRVPQEWKINKKALPYLTSLSEEELVSLLTLMAFIPESYKKLSIFKPLLGLISRLSEEIDEEKKKRIESSFSYEFQFLEKFVVFDDRNLKQIHNAILSGKALIVSYKGSECFKMFPIKIFVYNGVLYVGAINNRNEYRTYYLAGLKIIEELDESISQYLRKKYEKATFTLEEEKPFLLGIRVYAKEGMKYFEEPVIFPTQFFFKQEGESYLVYLVGYTGSRFTSRFLVEEIIEIIPPTSEIIAKAKELRVKEKFPVVTFSLRENRRRFKLFIEELEEFLNQRLTTFEKLKNTLL